MESFWISHKKTKGLPPTAPRFSAKKRPARANVDEPCALRRREGKQSVKAVAETKIPPTPAPRKKYDYAVGSATEFALILVHGSGSGDTTHAYVPIDHPQFYEPLRLWMALSAKKDWSFKSSLMENILEPNFLRAWKDLKPFLNNFDELEKSDFSILHELTTKKKNSKRKRSLDSEIAYGIVDTDEDEEYLRDEEDEGIISDIGFLHDGFVADDSILGHSEIMQETPASSNQDWSKTRALKAFAMSVRSFFQTEVKEIGYSIKTAIEKNWAPSYYIRMELDE